MNINEINIRTGQVLDAAIRVHRATGPGLLESAYTACLAYELRKRSRVVELQVAIPLTYEDVQLDIGYRVDLLVDNAVVVELKAVPKLLAVHEAQLLSYLRMGHFQAGLLINFHAPMLKDGVKRMVNQL